MKHEDVRLHWFVLASVLMIALTTCVHIKLWWPGPCEKSGFVTLKAFHNRYRPYRPKSPLYHLQEPSRIGGTGGNISMKRLIAKKFTRLDFCSDIYNCVTFGYSVDLVYPSQ